MATIKSYTDLEQSRKLAKILPLESAGMHYGEYCAGGENYPIPNCDDDYNGHCCWSLSALLNVLPKIQGGKPIIALDDNYITYPHTNDLYAKADSLVDACYEMIIKLNELNLL